MHVLQQHGTGVASLKAVDGRVMARLALINM